MIKTKLFSENFDKPNIDVQINKWIAKHPDIIIVDVKFNSSIYTDDDYDTNLFYSALVIYREYENV
ncbi:sporulation protein Cse60 [Limosilactobacillus mucosae]|uniref:sporulation protein Cse60 n=1 Tax=Limosilactobacillus mucosae TaxID=97478 RepID=UPI003D0125CB